MRNCHRYGEEFYKYKLGIGFWVNLLDTLISKFYSKYFRDFFYKLKNSSSELFLTSLIEKSLDNNWNSVVLFDSIERMEEINDLLCLIKIHLSFPHGSENDENSKFHRVYLTCKEENPNDSKVIFQ
ncbi:MAG: hypothetical protein CM15mP29_3250 [Alphaproteobacteria bacterium]|nr:MAG: hypothetical protein CM15mP29_3250 [Alphaproteobacteria bacterium]